MPEAWLQPWQELQGSGGGARRATAMEAAAEVRGRRWRC